MDFIAEKDRETLLETSCLSLFFGGVTALQKIGFSKDQEMIQMSIREFLEKECPSEKVRELEEDEKGYDPEIWKKMAELGWMGIVFPEEYYGTEGDFIDLMIVMEEMGRKLLPSPLFPTIALSALPILEFGNSNQKERKAILSALGLDTPM